MKKVVLSVFAIASMMAFVSCGPSAEQKAAAEKAIADSTAAAELALADAEAKKMQAEQDSLAKLTVAPDTAGVAKTDANVAH